jgi:hypothetical protein
MIKFLHNLALFRVKNTNFCENILNIVTWAKDIFAGDVNLTLLVRAASVGGHDVDGEAALGLVAVGVGGLVQHVVLAQAEVVAGQVGGHHVTDLCTVEY